MSSMTLQQVRDAIIDLPENWHGAGSMSANTLARLTQVLSEMPPINLSVETGSGKTTLLFSHASNNHKTFAVDDGNGSISNVKESELFQADSVEFIEGPAQVNVPAFNFDKPIDVALIDGPHGYPFPDLEYYHFYPHIREGGLLLLDDIQIPTIQHIFITLKADDMWELIDVVDNLAFFKRTSAEGVSPLEDGWWKQGLNRSLYERNRKPPTEPSASQKLTNSIKRAMPPRIKEALKILIRGVDG